MIDFFSQGFENLRYLNFNGCETLTEICDISVMPNLVILDLQQCSNLEFFSSGLKSKSLEVLNLGHCYKLIKFPDVVEEMECLNIIDLRASGISELPTSIENITGLRFLNLDFCEHLVLLPSSIYRLKNLDYIGLNACFRLLKFPQRLNSAVVSSNLLELDWIMPFNHFYSSVILTFKERRLPMGWASLMGTIHCQRWTLQSFLTSK